MSHSLIIPLLLLYTNTLHSDGWNSAAVMTSVSSSMLAGLMSTMSGGELGQGNVTAMTTLEQYKIFLQLVQFSPQVKYDSHPLLPL